MNLGSKLLPGSIVALFLGVFLATPLLYTNIVVAPVVASGTELFDVDVVYAYIEQHNETVPIFEAYNTTSSEPTTSSDFFTGEQFFVYPRSVNLTLASSTTNITVVTHFLALNFTRVSLDYSDCDAKTEVYVVSFYSPQGLIGSEQKYQGIVYNEDSVSEPIFSVFDQMEFHNGMLVSGTGGSFNDWSSGESRLSFSSGSGNSWTPNFGSPQTVTLSVERLGWFIVNGDSKEAVVLDKPQVVVEVSLDKYGSGFLYNTLIPESELNSTDLTQPQRYMYYGLSD